MIMGAGKTTVVAPTLGLLLADGRRLVMEVRCPSLNHDTLNLRLNKGTWLSQGEQRNIWRQIVQRRHSSAVHSHVGRAF